LTGWVVGSAVALRKALSQPSHEGASIHPLAKIYREARLVRGGDQSDGIAIGAHSHIRGELLLMGHGGKITIGDYCYVGEQTRIWSGLDIHIGNRVLIAHLVSIMDNLTHPLDPAARHDHYKAILETGHPRTIDLGDAAVRIEDDVWICAHAVILRGVTIGRAAVVAAGAVVTDDVPPGKIVAGNPARVIGDVPGWSDDGAPAGAHHQVEVG
jgi:acetyltransferase-like isoleucine patch superfamily enzyme